MVTSRADRTAAVTVVTLAVRPMNGVTGWGRGTARRGPGSRRAADPVGSQATLPSPPCSVRVPRVCGGQLQRYRHQIEQDVDVVPEVKAPERTKVPTMAITSRVVSTVPS